MWKEVVRHHPHSTISFETLYSSSIDHKAGCGHENLKACLESSVSFVIIFMRLENKFRSTWMLLSGSYQSFYQYDLQSYLHAVIPSYSIDITCPDL